jgi:ABC-2 type transport system permease protein
MTVLWRDASSVFFAVVFPVLLVAIIPTVNGGGRLEMADGQLLGGFFAATMAVYGAAVTAYVNMPQGIAEDRDRRVLKRVRATPLPAWALLLGRVVSALVVALLTLAAIYVLAGAMYRVGPALRDWPAVVLVLLVASGAFAVLGLAVVCLVRTAQAAVGLALGTLLPLTFVSDVFVVGAAFPPWLDAVSWFFPLRHATRAMTTVASQGGPFPWDHVGVLLLWGAAGLGVVLWRFRWSADDERSVRRTSARRVVREADVLAAR